MKTEKLKLADKVINSYWPLLLCGFYISMLWLDNLPKLNELTSFSEFQLLLNYKIGFIQRGLIGTLFLPIEYFTPMHFEIIFAVFALIFVCVYLGFCVWILHSNLDEKVSGYWILLMTFLPTNVGSFFKVLKYGNFDALMLSILMINAWLLVAKKRGALFISTFLVMIAMLIHSLYAFYFFAGTFDLLIWLWWKTKKKSYLIAAIIDTIIVISLLLYFNNGHPILFMPYEEIAGYITGRTSESMAYGLSLIPLWFSSSATKILTEFQQGLFYFTFYEAVLLYILLFPVITWIFAFWRRYYKNMGKPKIFWIFALSLIPILFMHIYPDKGRTMTAMFSLLFELVFTMI